MSVRLSLVCVVLVCNACTQEVPFPTDAEIADLQAMVPSGGPPVDATDAIVSNPGVIALGKAFFEDPSFSACGAVSCSSCHRADHAFADTVPTSVGCGGHTGRNAPSALNTAYYQWFGWDGRMDSIWGFATRPLTNPIEMGATPSLVRARLSASYAAEYQAIFGVDPGTEADDDRLLANFGKSIQAYVRTLIRVDSPFNDDVSRFLTVASTNDQTAIERDPSFLGLKTLVRTGRCVVCHGGPALSESEFRVVGISDASQDPGRQSALEGLATDPFSALGEYSDCNNTGGVRCLGANRLNNELSKDKLTFAGAFKTPGLRNVALTAPYMHTGGLNTLSEVVDFYDRGGDPDGSFKGTRSELIVKLNLTAAEKTALVHLLETMTDRSLAP